LVGLAAKLRRPGGPAPLHQRLVQPHPTESAVVELLAQGLTNPQIAERLFISRATVKTHLIHVFSQLGSAPDPNSPPTRHAALHRLPVIPPRDVRAPQSTQ
jgi:DNA-binding NarL/FixJ family response regulator